MRSSSARVPSGSLVHCAQNPCPQCILYLRRNAARQVLLSSVTAQRAPHYPFMPVKFFGSVMWPTPDPTPCHARLRSLLSL